MRSRRVRACMHAFVRRHQHTWQPVCPCVMHAPFLCHVCIRPRARCLLHAAQHGSQRPAAVCVGVAKGAHLQDVVDARVVQRRRREVEAAVECAVRLAEADAVVAHGDVLRVAARRRAARNLPDGDLQPPPAHLRRRDRGQRAWQRIRVAPRPCTGAANESGSHQSNSTEAEGAKRTCQPGLRVRGSCCHLVGPSALVLR